MSYVSSDPALVAQSVLVVQSTVSTESSLTAEYGATAEPDMMAQSGVPTTSESQPTSDQMALTQSVLVAQSAVPTDLTLIAQTDVQAQSVSSPSFRNLLMVPKKYGQAARSVLQVKRNRKVGHAVVITTSPYKRELEGMKSGKLKKQQAAEERKAAKTARKELQMVKKIEKELQKKAHTRNKVPVQSKERKRKKDLHDDEKTQPLQKRMQKSTHNKPSDADVSCLYCAELFSQSAKREKWIQCEQCMQWAHTACSGVGDKDKHFRCELC